MFWAFLRWYFSRRRDPKRTVCLMIDMSVHLDDRDMKEMADYLYAFLKNRTGGQL